MKVIDLVLNKHTKRFFLTLTSISMVLLNTNTQHYAFSSEWIKKQEDKSDINLIIKQIQDINYAENWKQKQKKKIKILI